MAKATVEYFAIIPVGKALIMIVTTSICLNYLPKARVLAESVKRFHPDAKFILSLVEKSVDPIVLTGGYFDEVLTPMDLSIPDLEPFLFKYSIVEASTAVKGHLMLKLLEKYPGENKVIYLDPDTRVFSPLLELSELLDSRQIVVTPHLTEPEKTLQGVMDNETSAMRHGIFNLGFLGIGRGPEAIQFLKWWAARLYSLCYADYKLGIFTDQKWIDLAPGFFDVTILKHPGYNVAPWNISNRELSYGPSKEILVNKLPLRFFHFSGFDSGANEVMIGIYCANQSSPVFKMREDYISACDELGQKEFGKKPWSFGAFDDGTRIVQNDRYVIRTNPKMFENPYVESKKFEGFRPTKLRLFLSRSKRALKIFLGREA